MFIVGCGRSGTTMLRLMLDSHPDLAIPGESHFIPRLWRAHVAGRTPAAGLAEADGAATGVDAQRLAAEAVRAPQFRAWGVSESAVWERVGRLPRPSFGEVIESLYLAYAGARGKSRWGDKTPQYVRSMPMLARAFPRSRFLHVIRDGRDVALSYLSQEWGPSNIWHAARQWRQDVSGGRRAGAALGPQRYLEVSYESLVGQPEAELRQVCGFLQLSWDDRMLQYHRDAGRRVHARSDRVDSHASATRPPTRGLRDWRTQMPRRQVMAFEAVCGPLLEQCGYALRHPRLPAGIRVEAAVRMAGMAAGIGRPPRRQVFSPELVGPPDPSPASEAG